MTYQTAKEVGEIIVLIGPQLIVLAICLGLYLATRKYGGKP